MQNGLVASLHGRFRDECFNEHRVRRRHPPPFPTRRSSDLGRPRPPNLATRVVRRSARCVSSCTFAGRNLQKSEISLQVRSEEHTSELQSRLHLVCRPLLEKKNCRVALHRPGKADAERLGCEPARPLPRRMLQRAPGPPPASAPFPYTTLFRSGQTEATESRYEGGPAERSLRK